MKRITVVSALLLLAITLVFAAEANQLATLTAGKGLITSFDVSQEYQLPINPQYSTDYDNDLFTFMSTVEDPYTTNGHGTRTYTAKNYELHIYPYENGENPDGFYFIHESNKTKKVNYGFDCAAFLSTYYYSYVDDATFVAENTTKNVVVKDYWGNDYDSKYVYKGYTFEKVSNTDYKLTFPGTKFFDVYGGTWRAEIMSMYRFFLKMEPGVESQLEEGNYTSYIKVHLDVSGNNTGRGGSNLDFDQIYCIRAHYSKDMQGVAMEVFTVRTGPDAYNMNLQDGLDHNVMSIKLFSTLRKNSKSSGVSDEQKYIVYISPTSSKNVSGSFVFRKIGSEHLTEAKGANAVEYTLYVTTDEDVSKTKTEFPTTTLDPSLSNSYTASEYKGRKQLTGTAGIGRTANGQMFLYPAFKDIELRSSAHILEWSLNADIWIKVNQTQAATLETGLYQSTVYVIVETKY